MSTQSILCNEPNLSNPKVQVCDVDNDMTEEEVKKCLYKRNLEDLRITAKQVSEEVNLRFETR